jgi:iron complex outermembrane receptor protein
MTRIHHIFAVLFLLGMEGSALLAEDILGPDALLDLNIEQLMHIPVTTAMRSESALVSTPAAVFVITADDLRRSGARSLPEALRLVPGMQVARIEANKWAVSSRGYDGRFARNMQVLVDGRSVYSSTFSSTEWEMLNIPIEEVERIEVIRGPGGSTWGSNAVGGIINIITRPTSALPGTRLTLGTGTEERAYALLQHAGRFGEAATYRAYAQTFERDAAKGQNGIDAADDWREGRVGLRLEWNATPDDRLTFQSDYYRGAIGQALLASDPTGPAVWPGNTVVPEDMQTRGGHFMIDWRRDLGPSSHWSLRSYYQFQDRDEITMHDRRHTYALEFEHRLPLGEGRHDLMWGADYKLVRDQISGSECVWFSERRQHCETLGLFIQDRIALIPDRLSLTLGNRFELTDRNGWEIQPSARLAFTPTDRQTWWAGVSRAVRIPSRMEFTAERWLVRGQLPPLYTARFVGSSSLEPEELIAYEIGARFLISGELSLDVTLFHHAFSDLITVAYREGTKGTLAEELVAINGQESSVYGIETALRCQPTPWWKLDFTYTFLCVNEHPRRGIDYFKDDWNEKDAPRHQVGVLSTFHLTRDLEFSLWPRYVDNINDVGGYQVSSYVTLDANLRWQFAPRYELTVAGQNLLSSSHAEYYPSTLLPTASTKTQRALSVQLAVQF